MLINVQLNTIKFRFSQVFRPSYKILSSLELFWINSVVRIRTGGRDISWLLVHLSRVRLLQLFATSLCLRPESFAGSFGKQLSLTSEDVNCHPTFNQKCLQSTLLKTRPSNSRLCLVKDCHQRYLLDQINLLNVKRLAHLPGYHGYHIVVDPSAH